MDKTKKGIKENERKRESANGQVKKSYYIDRQRCILSDDNQEEEEKERNWRKRKSREKMKGVKGGKRKGVIELLVLRKAGKVVILWKEIKRTSK